MPCTAYLSRPQASNPQNGEIQAGVRGGEEGWAGVLRPQAFCGSCHHASVAGAASLETSPPPQRSHPHWGSNSPPRPQFPTAAGGGLPHQLEAWGPMALSPSFYRHLAEDPRLSHRFSNCVLGSPAIASPVTPSFWVQNLHGLDSNLSEHLHHARFLNGAGAFSEHPGLRLFAVILSSKGN